MARPVVWILLVVAAATAAMASAPAEARRHLPPPADGPVVLAGEIHVAGSPAGLLELRLDGKLHASIPAGTGSFELTIPRDGSAGMVSLEFIAPDLRLRALLGGQGRLVRRAGPDGRLTVIEEDGLRVSPLSTAVAVLASSLDGVPPGSDVALADAVQAAWPSDIVLAGTAIARLAEEPWRLPDGFRDGLALAEDPAAFNKALQAAPGLVSEPHLVFDGLPATPLQSGDIGDVLILTGPRTAPGVPFTGQGMVMEREAGGFRLHDHMFYGPVWRGGVGAHDVLELEPTMTVVDFGGYFPCPSAGWDVMAVVETVRRDFRRRWQGEGVSLWQLGTDRVRRCPDCPELEPVAWRSTELSAAPDMLRTRLLTTPRRFVGRQSLPVFCGIPIPHGWLMLEPCGQADHVFASDGSGVVHPVDAAPQAFDWAQDGHGAIRVDYGDASARFWIIDDGDRPLYPVAYVAAGVVMGYPGTSGGQATLVRGGLDGTVNRRATARRRPEPALPSAPAPAPRYGSVTD